MMSDLPLIVERIEYGLLNGEEWQVKYFCESCKHEYFTKFHPSFGYDTLASTEYGTCSICKRDTVKRHSDLLNKKKQKRK